MDKVLLAVRKEPLLEFHCKQMDHFVGLHFSNNFHFALMVHLVKGKLFFYFVINLVNLIIEVEHQRIEINGKFIGFNRVALSSTVSRSN